MKGKKRINYFTGLISALIILVLILTFSQCYKKGPIFSLRSKVDRLSNFWVIDQYLEDGEDKTDSFVTVNKDFVWRFVKDNSYDFFGKVNGLPWSRSGEWHWKDSYKNILLQNQASDSTYEYHIIKLFETKLWFTQKDTVRSVTREWHLKERK